MPTMKKSLATLTFTALAFSATVIPGLMSRHSASAASKLNSSRESVAPAASLAAQDPTLATADTGISKSHNFGKRPLRRVRLIPSPLPALSHYTLLQFVKFGQRLDRAELIDVERGEGFERGPHASVRRHRFRSRLPVRRAVVIVQQFRGAADHWFGQSGQLRYVDAEALFGAPRLDFVQVAHLAFLFFDSQMEVPHARQIV